MSELDPLLPQSEAQPEQPLRKMVSRRSIILFVIADVLLIGTALLIGIMIGKQSQLTQLPIATPSPMATPQDETADDSVSEPAPVIVRMEPSPTPKQAVVVSPTPAPSVEPLVSTSGWQSVTIDDLTLKIPLSASIKKIECVGNEFEKCFNVYGHNPDVPASSFSFSTKRYLGGSRRQEAGLNSAEGSRSIVEKVFGKNKALEIFFICEISECTSMRQLLLVVGDQLVLATDTTLYIDPKRPPGSDPRVSPIANTIIASLQVR